MNRERNWHITLKRLKVLLLLAKIQCRFIRIFQIKCSFIIIYELKNNICDINLTSLVDPVERTVIEYSDRSLTSHYYG